MGFIYDVMTGQVREEPSSPYATPIAAQEAAGAAPWQAGGLGAQQGVSMTQQNGVQGGLTPYTQSIMQQANIQPGQTMESLMQSAGGALPPAVAAGLSAAGLSALVVPAAAGYGLTQLLGVQYPWETGAGEGMIAPWTPMKRDETGKWVTPQTRPDLFTAEEAGRMAGMLNGARGAVGALAVGSRIGNDVVTGVFNNASRDGSTPATVTFYHLASGKIGCFTKTGRWKTWRPRKNLVLGKRKDLGTMVKMQRKLDNLWRTVARKTKQLKLA